MISESELGGLRQAYRLAGGSPDPSTQVGAVLFCEGGRRIGGYNHLPDQYDGHIDLNDRDEKYFYILHAESAVILRAARYGIATEAAVLVCVWAPCSWCARAIVGAGISRVVTHQQRLDISPPEYRTKLDKALQYLIDSHVDVALYDGAIGGPKIRAHGRLWQP